MIKKIISGGHPGAERAALDAAIKLDIPHSGWAYKGRKTDEGILPEEYKLGFGICKLTNRRKAAPMMHSRE